MGRLKDFLIQMQEDERGVRLAETLGITYMELDTLDYEILTHESKDGLVYGYIIQFDKDSPKEILSKIKRLDGFQVELAPEELDTSEEEYYEERYEAIISNKTYYQTFVQEIDNLKKLGELKIDDLELKQILLRQIFIGVFGTLETFLSDTFINLTIESDEYLKSFVKSHPEFKQRKFELREVFDSYDAIRETAKKVMLDTIYHDLPKVKEMYSSTFKIEFPDLKDIIKQVTTRHDLVHRNGKTKEGAKVNIDKAVIDNLIKVVSDFAKEIANKLHLPDPIPELPF